METSRQPLRLSFTNNNLRTLHFQQSQLLKIFKTLQGRLQRGHSERCLPQSIQQIWWPHGARTQFICFSQQIMHCVDENERKISLAEEHISINNSNTQVDVQHPLL